MFVTIFFVFFFFFIPLDTFFVVEAQMCMSFFPVIESVQLHLPYFCLLQLWIKKTHKTKQLNLSSHFLNTK